MALTPNRRIFLNVVATYGRSLYALVIGLFCGRWTLMTLGEVDYGLYGLVGGLTAFVTFLNGLMAAGIVRFYSVSVGAAQKDPEKGLEECHKWFTTAVTVHTLLPTILMIVGYPVGEWAVRHFLTVPPDRVQSCVWVWRCVCVSTFVGMASAPFTSWYCARQEIAELTIYGFATTTLNACFMYYAVHHPGDWLAPLAAWSMLLSVVPSLVICARAGILYPECKFRWRHVATTGRRVWSMLSYSGWLVIGTLADLLGSQGINILVNKCFGPRFNAAQTVGNTLSGQCQTLSGSLTGAFWPVVMTAYGAGETDKVRKYAYSVSRVATVLILVFAIPLALEVDEVLLLWLKSPPAFAAGLCLCGLVYAVIDETSYGYALAAHATGRLAAYQMVVGGVFLLALPVAAAVAFFGGGVCAVAASIVAVRFGVVAARVVMARRVVDVSVRYWVTRILIPLALLIATSTAVGLVPMALLPPSFLRIVITTASVEFALLPLTWFFMFDASERQFVRSKFLSRLPVLGEKFVERKCDAHECDKILSP